MRVQRSAHEREISTCGKTERASSGVSEPYSARRWNEPRKPAGSAGEMAKARCGVMITTSPCWLEARNSTGLPSGKMRVPKTEPGRLVKGRGSVIAQVLCIAHPHHRVHGDVLAAQPPGQAYPVPLQQVARALQRQQPVEQERHHDQRQRHRHDGGQESHARLHLCHLHQPQCARAHEHRPPGPGAGWCPAAAEDGRPASRS